MKKLFLTSALALAVTAGATAPAHAGQTQTHDDWIDVQSYSSSSYSNTFSCIPFASKMIALLVPAVQSARSAS